MTISSISGSTYVSPYVAPSTTTTSTHTATQSPTTTNSVTVSVSSTARVMLASATVAPTTYTAADAVAKYKAAIDAGTLADLEQLKIQDTAANIQANLADLSALAKDKKLSGVVLSGTAPSLTIDRSTVTGDLASTASTNGTALLLQKISSGYTLKIENATAADALTLKKPSTAATLSINVRDTAASVGTNLDKLQALVKSKTISGLTLTDGASAPLKATVAQLTSAADLLKAVKGSYKIAVDNLTAASALSLRSPAANGVLSITVKDSAANISNNLDRLQALVKSGNISALSITDGSASPIKLTSAQATSASDLLGKLQGTYKLAVSGVKTADVTQTLTVKNISTISVSDTAANVQANMTSLGDLAKAKKLSAVTLTSTAPSLTIDRTTVTGDLSSLTTTNGTIQLLQRITNAHTLQISNVSAKDALTLKSPNKMAKLAIGVKDTAANVLANLDKLQPLASSKTASSITFSDQSAPTLKITSAQLAAGSAAIKAIQGSYQLHVTNVKAAEVAKIGAQTNVASMELLDTSAAFTTMIKANLPGSTLDKITSAQVTDPLSVSSAYKLLELINFENHDNALKYTISDTASNIIARQRYDLGNVMKWATKVTITNKTAPTLSVADARTFTTITKLDPAIKFSIADGGKAIAEQAAIAGDKVLSSASSISINKSFSIAEAKRVIALSNLDKSTKYSITDTVANILAASPTEKALLGAMYVNIVDSSQNIVDSLNQLQALAKTNKIATLQITDTSTKRLFIGADQLIENSDVLGKLIQSLIFTPSFTDTSTTGVQMRIIGPLSTLGGPLTQESNLTSVQPVRDGAVSRDGSIVVGGSLNADNKFHAYSFRNGSLEDLGSLSAINDYSVAKGISADNSTIVGYSKTDFNFNHAVMWKDGLIHDLGTLPGGRFSQANAASADGRIIVGLSESSNTDGRIHAVMWKDGVIHDLGVQNGINSGAAAVSDDGSVIVGTNVGTIYSAFVWEDGVMTTIPGFANEGGVGLIVSPDGSTVFGHSNITNGGNSQSFAYKNGLLTNIGSQAGYWNAPVASSFDGQIVAHYNRAASNYHAFVTKNGTTFDLGTLAGYSNFRPLSLSDDGAVVTGAISNEANETLIVQWRVPN